jgi:tRNA-dihydrouridine synthase B
LAGRVGFKLRLGWSPEEENYLELARGLEQCGAAWLTLHPRYARQGFAGSADSAALEALVRTVDIPVIASGDLLDARAALRVVRQTGVSGVMFARGALHNPAVFKDYALLLAQGPGNGGEKAEEAGLRPDPEFLKTLILRHAQLAQTTSQAPERSVFKMRGALPRYVKNLPGSKAFRMALSRCASWTEFYKLLEDFFGGHYAGD